MRLRIHAETVIESGLKTFWQVGEALAQVRDGKLYRETLETFEGYCRERWNLDHNHARRLIHASEVCVNFESMPIGILPESESQIRPLTPLKPADQVAAWQDAIASAPEGKPTAKHVAAAVERKVIGRN